MNFKKLLKKVQEFIGSGSKKETRYCKALKKSIKGLNERKDAIKSELKNKPKKSVRNELLEELKVIEKQKAKVRKLSKKCK